MPAHRRRPAAWPWAALLLPGLLCAAVSTGAGAEEPARFDEYEVKAVFLYRLAQFVEWPVRDQADDSSALIIGVLGNDPFGPILDQTVEGESIKGRPLVIKRFRRLESLGHCHMLFVSRSEESRFPQILKAVAHMGILTVSDSEAFIRPGGIVAFRTSQNRVHIEINLAAARREGFKISSKLLSLAGVVETDGNAEGP